MKNIVDKHPMTWLSTGYALVVFALFSTGVVEADEKNLMRLVIAGFLLVCAATITVIGVTAMRLHDRATYDGLPPRLVGMITAAAALTILWVCVELWSRTLDAHFTAPVATVWAAVAAVVWCASLAGLLRYQTGRLS